MYTYEFSLEKQEFIDFNIYVQKNKTNYKKTIWGVRIMGPILFVLVGFMLSKNMDTYGGVIFNYSIWGIASILWLLLIEKHLLRTVTKKLHKLIEKSENDSLLIHRTLEISETCIRSNSNLTSSRINWDGVIAVEESDKALYIFISAVQAVIIPKRILRDEIEISDLISYCKEQAKIGQVKN